MSMYYFFLCKKYRTDSVHIIWFNMHLFSHVKQKLMNLIWTLIPVRIHIMDRHNWGMSLFCKTQPPIGRSNMTLILHNWSSYNKQAYISHNKLKILLSEVNIFTNQRHLHISILKLILPITTPRLSADELNLD